MTELVSAAPIGSLLSNSNLIPITTATGEVLYSVTPRVLGGLLNSGLQSAVNELVVEVAAVQLAIGNTQAAEDSAYQAQDYETGAAASALAARLSQAQYFPSDFGMGTEYWTQGNGQVSAPEVAANQPLVGTFVAVSGVAQVYQTEPDPESCNSFGNLGYIVGVPGTKITVTSTIRAITDLSNGAVDPNTGVALLPLDSDWSLIDYMAGAGLGTLTVAEGWQTVVFDFEVPEVGDTNYAPYYRPSLFYNVVGVNSPLDPSDATQGNQQFQVQGVEVLVQPPGTVSGQASNLIDLSLSGTSGSYSPSAGCTWIKVWAKGAGGGGGGGGSTTSVAGGNGGNTVFGSVVAAAGLGGGGFTSAGYSQGGFEGSSTLPSGNYWLQRGGVGANGPGGYTYAAGGAGGGGVPGLQGGTAPTSPTGSGKGGPGGGTSTGGTIGPGAGGAEGDEIEFTMIAPTSAVSWSIGAGGTAGTAGVNGSPGTAGSSGHLVVQEYFG